MRGTYIRSNKPYVIHFKLAQIKFSIYVMRLVQQKPKCHYRSNPLAIGVLHHPWIYTWALLGPGQASGRADQSPTRKILAHARPNRHAKKLAQARPITEKAHRASGWATTLNRIKSRPGPGPTQASGQKSGPARRHGRSGLAQEFWARPGCPWPGIPEYH